MIEFPCPHCRNMLQFSESQVGLSGPCAYCGASVSVHAPTPPTQARLASLTPAMAGVASVADTTPGFMTVGRLIGFLFIFIGALMWAVAGFTLAEFGSTFKVLVVGPVICLVGIAMSVFPGYPVGLAENRAPGADTNKWHREAPMMHKIAWGVAGAVGIVFMLALLF